MEKSMLGHAVFLTSLKKSALSGMIEIVKGIEPETGYGSILQVGCGKRSARLAISFSRKSEPISFLPVKFMGAGPGRDDRMTFRRVAADDEDQIGFFDIGDRTRVAGQAHGTE